ncbi:MAG TPA: GTPase HflX [Candidatus Bathyarchaeia archaeon]|nr:GTPase HflX [Candidatus Bathyarchaeia archaeon]
MQRRRNFEPSSLDELKRLAESAGYAVVGKMDQTRPGDARYQIGPGKVEELAQLVKEKEAKKVIFDNPLSPLQAYNLAKATHVEIIDRFELILEIFTKRATTTEAQMQIELAKLQRDLSRAKEKIRLTKKGEQPGFMGLGSYEVDVYYESVKREVHAIRRKLKKIRGKRVLHRQRRAELGFPSISLAGYTHAGKSSLFNALTEEQVTVNTTLFTTLSTTTRLVEFFRKKFLLTDTVGFIDRLPLTLIEAFHSTLEETIYSDLILLVVDASEPSDVIEKKLAVCLETIDRIEASGVPVITVLNKIDLMSEIEIQQKLDSLREKAPNPVLVSALRKVNLDQLKRESLKILGNYVRASFTIPLSNEAMSFISSLFKDADVKDVKYMENLAEIVFEASPSVAEKVRNRVERFNGKFVKC